MTGPACVLGEKPVPVPLAPLHISRGLTWDRRDSLPTRQKKSFEKDSPRSVSGIALPTQL